MSDPNDHSIPLLNEVLVPGRAGGAPRDPEFRREPVLAPQPLVTPEHLRAPEPVMFPEPAPLPDAMFDAFARLEPPPPLEAGATVPPDIAHEPSVARQAAALLQADLNADEIASRLRTRVAGFLTGDGRGIIEARCRDALREHTNALVSQVTREVVLTLESELTGWVREAVEEEFARRSRDG